MPNETNELPHGGTEPEVVATPDGIDPAAHRAMNYMLGRVGVVNERVMMFIDGGYLEAVCRDQYPGKRIDLAKFGEKFASGRRLLRSYYYNGRIERPPDDYWKERQKGQQRLESALAYVPRLEIRWGRLQFDDSGNPRQKGVDVQLALDMLRFALKKNYDTAILVSGDGDFADIVQMVKDEGLKVETVTFPGTRAWALLQAADLAIEVNEEMLKDCWLTSG